MIQLSPEIAKWITKEFNFPAIAIRDPGLRDADATEIFQAARKQSAIVMTKDADSPKFLEMKSLPKKLFGLPVGIARTLTSKKI